VVNITAVRPDGAGYLTAWNAQGSVPLASTLNFTAGKVVPNLAIVRAAYCDFEPSCYGMRAIAIYNGSSKGVHVLVDLVGVFDDSTLDGGLRFRPLNPTRIVDTRIGQGAPGPLGPDSTVAVTAPGSVADSTTGALALNVTAVRPSTGTFLTVWPTGLTRPTVSNLNPAAGQTVPNAAITALSPALQFNVYNSAGTVNFLVDVVGAFEPGITTAPRTALRDLGSKIAPPAPIQAEPHMAFLRQAVI
jgi:hypothetical protein